MNNDILFTSSSAQERTERAADKLPSPLIARASVPRHFAYVRFTAQGLAMKTEGSEKTEEMKGERERGREREKGENESKKEHERKVQCTG